MIYTVTFNPSLDYIVCVDDFQLGMTNRTSKEMMLPGGKGINVSIVLKNLGIANTAWGFTAGFTGTEIARRVETFGVTTDFIEVPEGFSRINFKLTSIDGTEVNGAGPVIGEEQLSALTAKIDAMQPQDMLVLAGSIPKSMPDSMYSDIMKRLQDKNIDVVVDATSTLLLNVLPYHPFLIKPNHHELGEIFGVTIETQEDVVPYAMKLQEKGARNVLISMGGKGAVLVAEDKSVYFAKAPSGTLKNSVGAGDSMVAGFVAGWMQQKTYEHAFKMGVSTGSASAFSDNLATEEEVNDVYKRVDVKTL